MAARPERIPELPHALTPDRDYWLRRCEGFECHGGDGPLGRVRELRYRSRHDLPDGLVVHGGRLGHRVTFVPVGEVLEVLPHELRIVVSTRSRQAARPRLGRVRAAIAQLHSAVHLP